MDAVTLCVDKEVGYYNPEEGDLSQGLLEDCEFLGSLRSTVTGEIDTAVYTGKTMVILLTLDAGYGKSSIRICDFSVLIEISKRLIP